MATTNGNRQILDLKRWEPVSPAPAVTAAAHFIASGEGRRQNQLLMQSTTSAYLYNPLEDGWVAVPSPALAGTFAAGSAGCGHAFSTGSTVGAASLTATGGTTSTIVTNQSLARDLRGYQVQILSGPNAGSTIDIVSNTTTPNATITVTTQASAFTASTVYRLITPRWYVLGSGTLASGSFKVYDYATNSWTTLAHAGLAATIATDGKLVATPSYHADAYNAFATGTATSGGASTLTNSSKAWTVNQWTNYQIRITAGTGAGQIRAISSNTATVITVGTAWTTQPDATSAYSLEANDDYLYYLGNNAVTMYRYSISANTWTTLSPGVARGAAPGLGMSAQWVDQASATDWTSESAILNGKYIYSFRGGAATGLDRYDIAANSWSSVTYSPATEGFTTGSKYTLIEDYIYIQKEATGRWFKYDVTTAGMDGWTVCPFPNSTAVVGDTVFNVTYKDGATKIHYIYFLLNSSVQMFRAMVI